MDFLSYLAFMFLGMVLAAYLGWRFMRWEWSDKRTEAQKTWLSVAIAAVLAALGASR